MLQMKCPECDEFVRSPFLVEIGAVTCDHCKETVAVKDVFVTTRLFTMHRDTLLQRIRHYRNLLKEVEREKRLVDRSDDASTATRNSMEKYHDALRELLEASRENYRLAISEVLPLDIDLKGSQRKGKLLNLSTKGAAIKPLGLNGFPLQGTEVKLRLSLPDVAEPLSLIAKIAWIGKPGQAEEEYSTAMGVSFVDLDERTSVHLWDYLVDAYRNSSAMGS